MNNTELLDVLWQALNKANLKGVFNINESFLLKVVNDKLIEKLNDGSNTTNVASDSVVVK
jgi:hypothetical protein